MNKIVEQFQELNFNGDIIPHTWYETSLLKHKNGKPNMVAIILLANICYWYRPQEVVDETTNRVMGIKQKFTYDKLRMFYQQWADKYGYTKRQVQDAIAFLKKAGLITVELRTVRYEGSAPIANVPHVEPVFKAVREITLVKIKEKTPISRYNVTPIPVERDTYPGRKGQPSRYNVGRKSKITDETTNKTTTENTQTEMGGATASAAPSPQGHSPTPAPVSFSDSSNSNRSEEETPFPLERGSPQAIPASAGAGRAASATSERLSASGPAISATAAPTSGLQLPGAAAGRPAQENATRARTAPTRVGSGKPRDPNLDHPAVVAYKEFWRYYPEEWARELIAKHVGEDEGSLEDWESAMRHWQTISGNFKNVNQQVKIYLDREWERPLTNDRNVQRDWDEHVKAIQEDERDTIDDHPALVRFHEIWYCPERPIRLNSVQRKLIVEEIGDDPVAIEGWAKAVEYWSGISGTWWNLQMQFQIFHTREWEQKRGGASGFMTAAEKEAENYRRVKEDIAAEFAVAREQEEAKGAAPEVGFFESLFGGQEPTTLPDDAIDAEYVLIDEAEEVDDVTAGDEVVAPVDVAVEPPADKAAIGDATDATPEQASEEDYRITMYRQFVRCDPTPEQAEQILAEVENQQRWPVILAKVTAKEITDFKTVMAEYRASVKRSAR